MIKIINLSWSKIKSFVKETFIVVFPIVLGVLIYFFYREPSFNFIKWFGLNEKFTSLSVRVNLVSLPSWVIYNLPDGLWVFSFTYLVLFIYKFKFSKKTLFFTLFVPIIISLISEIGQYFGFMQGTYDSFDILCYLIGFFLPILLSFRKIKITK